VLCELPSRLSLRRSPEWFFLYLSLALSKEYLIPFLPLGYCCIPHALCVSTFMLSSATSCRSSMILLYSACSASLSATTLTNSIEFDYVCNWISYVTLVCKLCSMFNNNCDNTKSIWVNFCTCSCIYDVGNSIAHVDFFMIRCSIVVDGCDVVGHDSVVFVVLSVCSFFIVQTGIILVDSKIWRSVAICAYTFVCISSCFITSL
jgi:hypothetical protein